MIKKTKVFPSSWPETAQGEDAQWGFQAQELGPGPSTRRLSTAPSPPSNRHHPQAWGAAHRESPSPTASTATTATAHSRPIPAPAYLPPLLLLPLTKLLQAPQLLAQGQGQLDVGAAHILHFWGQSKDGGPRCQTWGAPTIHTFAPAWASPPQPHSSSLSPPSPPPASTPGQRPSIPTGGGSGVPRRSCHPAAWRGEQEGLTLLQRVKGGPQGAAKQKDQGQQEDSAGELEVLAGPGDFYFGGRALAHSHTRPRPWGPSSQTMTFRSELKLGFLECKALSLEVTKLSNLPLWQNALGFCTSSGPSLKAGEGGVQTWQVA